MSWTAEVLHLLRRELRRTTWPLVAYIATLLLAVGTATEVLRPIPSLLFAVGQLVMLLASLLVATTVLADSTQRVDAFWATQPIRASAVIASKLLFLLLLLTMCAMAILVALTGWQLRVVSADAVAGASFTYFAILLLGTAVLATACSSLTAVGLLLGVTFALTLGGTLAMGGAHRALTLPMWATVTCLMAAGSGVLFARAYLQPKWSVARRGMLLFSGVSVVVVPALTLGEQTQVPTPEVSDSAVQSVALRMPLVSQPECAAGRVTLPVEVASPPTWRVELMRPSVVLTLIDGSLQTLSSERWMASAGIWGPMIPGTAPRADGASDPDSMTTRVRRTDIAFDLSRSAATRVCGRVASAMLRIQVRTSFGAELMRVDLGSVETVPAPGYRVTIESAQVSDTGVAIDVRVAMLGSAMAGRRNDIANLDFALLHRGQKRLLALHEYESKDVASMTVLPGLRHMSGIVRLERFRSGAARPRDLQSWRDSAALLVIAPAWQAAGERVVSAMVPIATGGTAASR